IRQGQRDGRSCGSGIMGGTTNGPLLTPWHLVPPTGIGGSGANERRVIVNNRRPPEGNKRTESVGVHSPVVRVTATETKIVDTPPENRSPIIADIGGCPTHVRVSRGQHTGETTLLAALNRQPGA